MNKTSRHTVCILLLLCFFFIGSFVYAPAFSSGDDIDSLCLARCSGFTGQAYYQCIQTCVRTMKKHQPREEKKVSQRMSECEEICSVYEKVERVRCLRLCMDRNKGK